MALKFKYVLFFLALISMASIGTSAWAGHGGHGGGHGGHGWGGGHGGGNWHGGHGHFYGNNFAGWGRGYGWGHGYSNRFYGGYWPYLASNLVYGWPYRSYYRPYATYSYPYYSYPYYSDDCDCNYTVAESLPQYVASTPVDGAVEERLPEPALNLSVEGQPTSPTGTIHQLSSPVLNAPELSVPMPQAKHHDGDRLVTDERKVDAKAHSLVISDFKQPQEMARSRSMPQPTSSVYAKVTAAELRDWLRLR
jgi:hypothetical protein